MRPFFYFRLTTTYHILSLYKLSIVTRFSVFNPKSICKYSILIMHIDKDTLSKESKPAASYFLPSDIFHKKNIFCETFRVCDKSLVNNNNAISKMISIHFIWYKSNPSQGLNFSWHINIVKVYSSLIKLIHIIFFKISK